MASSLQRGLHAVLPYPDDTRTPLPHQALPLRATVCSTIPQPRESDFRVSSGHNADVARDLDTSRSLPVSTVAGRLRCASLLPGNLVWTMEFAFDPLGSINFRSLEFGDVYWKHDQHMLYGYASSLKELAVHVVGSDEQLLRYLFCATNTGRPYSGPLELGQLQFQENMTLLSIVFCTLSATCSDRPQHPSGEDFQPSCLPLSPSSSSSWVVPHLGLPHCRSPYTRKTGTKSISYWRVSSIGIWTSSCHQGGHAVRP